MFFKFQSKYIKMWQIYNISGQINWQFDKVLMRCMRGGLNCRILYFKMLDYLGMTHNIYYFVLCFKLFLFIEFVVFFSSVDFNPRLLVVKQNVCVCIL